MSSAEEKRLTRETSKPLIRFKRAENLDENKIMWARNKLLSFGIFKSVFLRMQKGTQRGLAHLIIEVEEENSVIGDWSLGGIVSIMHAESLGSSKSIENPPSAYRLGLVSRNLFQSMHQGEISCDLDNQSNAREINIIYAIPYLTSKIFDLILNYSLLTQAIDS